MSVDYTPGPWTTEEPIDGHLWVVQAGLSSAEWEPIAHISCGYDSECMPLKEWPANARLISASPDMFEALKDMLAGWQYIRQRHGDLDGVGWDRAEEKAKAAIAKASKGESQ